MSKEINEKDDKLGVLIALMRRGHKRRIPRLIRIKQAVDSGERLSDNQINFLARALDDATRAQPYCDQHPELQELAAKMVSLYHDITEQALKNEEDGTARGDIGAAPRAHDPEPPG